MDIFSHALLPYLLGSSLRMNKKLLAAFVLGGIAPDLDLLVVWIAGIYPTSLLIVHRGFTHTFFFGFLTVLIVLYLASRHQVLAAMKRFIDFDVEFSAAALAFAYAGILCHLFLDFLTTRGVPLLYPLETTRFSAEIYYHTEFIVLIGSLAVLTVLFWDKNRSKGRRAYKERLGRMPSFNKNMFMTFVALLLIVGAVRIEGKEAAQSLFENKSAEFYPDSSLISWVALENCSDRFRVHEFNVLSERIEHSYEFPRLNVETNGEPLPEHDSLSLANDAAKSLPQFKLFRWRAYGVATNASWQNESWHLEYYDPVVKEEMTNAWPIFQMAVKGYGSVHINVRRDEALLAK